MTREDHHGIFFNLANSCLVIDEADFYDDFTQANILVLLEVCKILQVPVLLMSATLPESAKQVYSKSGFDKVEIKEDHSQAKIERCQIHEKVNYENIGELEPYLLKCMQQPSIIYANTVDKAVRLYEWFVEEKGFQNVTLYHSRFTEPDKRKIEGKLITNLGKEAWEKEEASGIAIMTQIGEMSVNISADYMLTDACPADRLVQRVGRCSRFREDTVGKVIFMIPYKDEQIYPAPYGSFKPPNTWEPNLTLKDTIEQLKEEKYTSQDFVNLVNAIYAESTIFSTKAEQNAKELKRHLLHNWLIVPKAQTKPEEEETEMWKSRDIPANQDVLVKETPRYFPSYYDYLNFKMIYSVSLPNYLIERGKKANLITASHKFYWGDQQKEEEYLLLQPSYYDDFKGVKIEKRDVEDCTL